MAKVRSIIEISGTLSETTFVNSKAYGTHARAKRGTYKPITLSEGMKKSAAVQTQVNQIAKIIFDAVNGFVPGFKDGKFWSRMLSVLRKQKKAGKNYSYSDFNLMEMRYDYSTSRQGSFRLVPEKNGMQLHYELAKDTAYCLKLLRIATDATLLNPYPTEMLEVIVDYTKCIISIPFVFSALPSDANRLYVLHCEQMLDGLPTGMLKSRGVRFFA